MTGIELAAFGLVPPVVKFLRKRRRNEPDAELQVALANQRVHEIALEAIGELFAAEHRARQRSGSAQSDVIDGTADEERS